MIFQPNYTKISHLAALGNIGKLIADHSYSVEYPGNILGFGKEPKRFNSNSLTKILCLLFRYSSQAITKDITLIPDKFPFILERISLEEAKRNLKLDGNRYVGQYLNKMVPFFESLFRNGAGEISLEYFDFITSELYNKIHYNELHKILLKVVKPHLFKLISHKKLSHIIFPIVKRYILGMSNLLAMTIDDFKNLLISYSILSVTNCSFLEDFRSLIFYLTFYSDFQINKEVQSLMDANEITNTKLNQNIESEYASLSWGITDDMVMASGMINNVEIERPEYLKKYDRDYCGMRNLGNSFENLKVSLLHQ